MDPLGTEGIERFFINSSSSSDCPGCHTPPIGIVMESGLCHDVIGMSRSKSNLISSALSCLETSFFASSSSLALLSCFETSLSSKFCNDVFEGSDMTLLNLE